MEKIIFQSDDGTAAELQAVYAVFQQMLDDVNFEWRSDF